MDTFALGLIVILYLLSISFFGFLGYRKTTTTGWTYNGVKVDSVGVWDIDVDGYEVQLISKWKSKYSDNF